MVDVGASPLTPSLLRPLLIVLITIGVLLIILSSTDPDSPWSDSTFLEIIVEILFGIIDFFPLLLDGGDLCFSLIGIILDGDGEGCALCLAIPAGIASVVWRLMVGVGEAVGIDMDGDGDTDGIDERAESFVSRTESEEYADDAEDEWYDEELDG